MAKSPHQMPGEPEPLVPGEPPERPELDLPKPDDTGDAPVQPGDPHQRNPDYRQ